jgi:hypothetical protein
VHTPPLPEMQTHENPNPQRVASAKIQTTDRRKYRRSDELIQRSPHPAVVCPFFDGGMCG